MIRVANYCPNCGAKLIIKTHSGQQRPTCPDCDFIVYHDPKVAVIAVVIQDNRVLLVQRANDPGKGKWACPAGFVDYDESPEDATLRELQEETGYVGRVVRLLDVFPKKDNGLADIVIAYHVEIIGGALHPADDADDAQWFTRDALPDLVFYPSITLIGERWRNGDLVL
ncbi:MAG: NUDIX domain-containing protein [Chloroflexota bacterium]